MGERSYYVYIMASRSRTLYIGFTRDPDRRIFEHKTRAIEGFASRYRCERLVLLERYTHALTAITREKQLKGWLRARKIELIEATNPTWVDLSEGWGKPIESYVGEVGKTNTGPSLRSG